MRDVEKLQARNRRVVSCCRSGQSRYYLRESRGSLDPVAGAPFLAPSWTPFRRLTMIATSLSVGAIMDVVVWLRSLGLGKYQAIFRENDIDEAVLPSLTQVACASASHGAAGRVCKGRARPGDPTTVERAGGVSNAVAK